MNRKPYEAPRIVREGPAPTCSYCGKLALDGTELEIYTRPAGMSELPFIIGCRCIVCVSCQGRVEFAALTVTTAVDNSLKLAGPN